MNVVALGSRPWAGVSRHTGLMTGLAIISLAQVVFSWYVRRAHGEAFPSRYSLTHLHFDPYTVGLIVQEMVVPVALVFLVSGLGVFTRVANGRTRVRDHLYLFLIFALIQGLFYAYGYALNSLEISQVTRGFIVVMMAGLLGGPLIGLGIGMVTWLLMGLRTLLYWPPETFDLGSALYWYGVVNKEASSVLWLGLAAGLAASLLGRYRYVPGVAFVLGLCLELFARYFAALAMGEPGYWIEPLVQNMIITGLTLAIFTLIVRNVQVSFMRQRTEAAELATAQAELRALRAQINPHFLFNSLNTIRYFVRTSPDKARDLLLDLSEVFQRALKSGDFVPLRDEITYVEAYLALEKARLDERLKVEWTLPDPFILATPVPTLILQPLVENAVIHGIAQKPEGGTLRILIETWGGELIMQVRDDGVGFDPRSLKSTLDAPLFEPLAEPAGKAAIGLRNIHQRLNMLYEQQTLLIESEPGRGTRVQIKLPLAPLRELKVREDAAKPALPLARPPALEPEVN